ncbi:MAG: UDP-N-acetylmuramoyl-L-alanine--D-glutamate ligase, partial [Pseudomonadota bacterium]|nr:UDP-N-acetylmuramoyl-L-alanine--D-glutamate ligase [Pseudomonadota bacterium]
MIPVRGLEGRRVAVFGLGRTGLSAARALAAGGAKPVLWDDKAQSVKAAREQGFDVEDLSKADWGGFAALLLSPGVPLSHPEPHWAVLKAREAGVEIVGDVELFARAVNAAPEHKRPKIVAITGTNGKSTTTALVAHVLQHAGRDAKAGGNIGQGVLGMEDMHGGAIYVLELSSYQLDLTSSLKADAAVLLNLSPDHLERHGTMEGYASAKRRVFLNQTKDDTAIVGVDDPWGQRICTELVAANHRTIWPISAGRAMGRGVYALSGVLYDGTADRVVEVADLSRAQALIGRHNWQNAAAAYAVARSLGVPWEVVVEGLLSFPGLAHRMETVAQVGGVRLVNDSKATNAEAARQAMAAFPRLYWIAGGRPKAGGIDSLADLFPRVAKAYLIGEAAADFSRTLEGRVDHAVCGDLAAAVEAAYADAAAEAARTGEAVVLLSPACASFDQFPDFEARGEAFRAAALALEHSP